MIGNMLVVDAKKRPSAEDIMNMWIYKNHTKNENDIVIENIQDCENV
jgi:hypothetical protein